MPPNYAVLATSDADAAERFEQFRNVDPLHSVQPSLLTESRIIE